MAVRANMQAQPDNYLWDVFISYKRNTLIGSWVTDYFLERFTDWLTEKLGELHEPIPPRVFFDQRALEPGSPWPHDLRKAIQTSKVLVAVCSPSYFYSPWCMSEWNSFAERERNLGVAGLRLPIRHNDSVDFLKDIQYFDFYGYISLAKGFYKKGKQAYSFEKKVEDFAAIVARNIHKAPPFQPNWPVIDGQPHPLANPPMQRL